MTEDKDSSIFIVQSVAHETEIIKQKNTKSLLTRTENLINNSHKTKKGHYYFVYIAYTHTHIQIQSLSLSKTCSEKWEKLKYWLQNKIFPNMKTSTLNKK